MSSSFKLFGTALFALTFATSCGTTRPQLQDVEDMEQQQESEGYEDRWQTPTPVYPATPWVSDPWMTDPRVDYHQGFDSTTNEFIWEEEGLFR